MKYLLCLGAILTGLGGCCSAPNTESLPDAVPSRDEAQATADTQAGPEDSPAAVLTVGLPPLRDGLAASAHRGPKRGVRRILKGPGLPTDTVSTATALRSPAAFEERSTLCSNCGLLQATVEIDFGTFSPASRGQDIERLGAGSVHVAVPVRAEAARSMSRPGWWEIRLIRDPTIPSSAEWVRPPATEEGQALSAPLTALGLEVAEAEGSMLPQRAPLLEVRPWPSETAAWRVERVTLRLAKRLVELQLFVEPGQIREKGAEASTVVVLGSEFQMTVSGGLAAQLSQTEEDDKPPPPGRASIETMLLADARGRLGKVVYSGPDGESHLFSGSFARNPKAPVLPQKPRRPGASGRLPGPRLR